MPDKSFPSFEEFFRAAHGVGPHAWQKAAARYTVQHGCLPRIVDVPPSLGKTALVDVWVWALARATFFGQVHGLGQRYVHAVERRIIVETASSHVNRLQAALNSATEGTLARVAAALEKLSDQPGERLFVTSFHGARADRKEWVQHPRGAVVLVTTASQLVLRVLGQAPGVSSKTAIVHAGLLGHDCAWVIDEPHLSPVIVDTLRQCADMAEVSLTCMGATLPDHLVEALDPAGTNTIRFEAAAETRQAKARYRAAKPARIQRYSGKSSTSQIVKELRTILRERDSGDERVIVYVNTVRDAVAVARRLENEQGAIGERTIRLVTSRVRAVDRDGDQAPQPGEIVVSTQTLEAGADFEVDVAITQCAPWPTLVQRLGRLNRHCGAKNPVAVILVPEEPKRSRRRSSSGENEKLRSLDAGSEAVYGLEIMWAMYRGLWTLSEADFRSSGLKQLQKRVLGSSSPWPEPARTGTLDAEYAALMLLAPAPEAVGLWLAGLDAQNEVAPVSVLWRDVLDPTILAVAPPRPGEQVDLPVALVRELVAGAWVEAVLDGEEESWSGYLSDLDDGHQGFEAGKAERHPFGGMTQRLSQVRLNRGGEWCVPGSVMELTPGTTVVLHTSLGGYRPDRGVWPCAKQVCDQHAVAGHVEVIALSDEMRDMSSRKLGDTLGKRVLARTDGHAAVTAVNAAANKRSASRIVPFGAHSSQTAQLAAFYVASPSALGKEWGQRVVEIGGLLHDLGKCHPRAQYKLGALPGDPLLAKSVGRTARPVAPEDRINHTVHGARVVEKMFPSEPLKAHLVFSHHGDRGSEHYLELCGSNPWLLAWQESMVRLADWAASADPQYEVSERWEISEAVLAAAAVDSVVEKADGLDLKGFAGDTSAAWYGAVGTAWAAQEVTGRTCWLSWPNGASAPRIHGAEEADLEGVADWFNDEFYRTMHRLNAWAEAEGCGVFGMYQRGPVRDVDAMLPGALTTVGESAVLQRMVQHLITPNASRRVENGKCQTDLSGGWLAWNGSVMSRLLNTDAKAITHVTKELFVDPTFGLETLPSVKGLDHALDHSDASAPTMVRAGAYRVVALGIACSGRPLTQKGPANARNRVRYLPRPTEPTTLWRLDVLGRLRQGPALLAEQKAFGKMDALTVPRVKR